MFLGAMLSKEQLAQVREMMAPPPTFKAPTYYGTDRTKQTTKKFGAVVSTNHVGAAEVLCETGHPIYGELAHEFGNRLPQSVQNNLIAGAM